MQARNLTPAVLLSRRGRAWTAAGAVAALSVIAAAVISLHGGKAQATANGAPPPTQVSVATVAESEINAWDEFSGRLEAVERVEVRSRVAGQVQAVHFREGALVAKGDLLITIDPAPYAAEAERAAAQAAGFFRQRDGEPAELGHGLPVFLGIAQIGLHQFAPAIEIIFVLQPAFDTVGQQGLFLRQLEIHLSLFPVLRVAMFRGPAPSWR